MEFKIIEKDGKIILYLSDEHLLSNFAYIYLIYLHLFRKFRKYQNDNAIYIEKMIKDFNGKITEERHGRYFNLTEVKDRDELLDQLNSFFNNGEITTVRWKNGILC